MEFHSILQQFVPKKIKGKNELLEHYFHHCAVIMVKANEYQRRILIHVFEEMHKLVQTF